MANGTGNFGKLLIGKRPPATYTGNTLVMGDGNRGRDKVIRANIGTAGAFKLPGFRYNHSTQKFEQTQDNITWREWLPETEAYTKSQMLTQFLTKDQTWNRTEILAFIAGASATPVATGVIVWWSGSIASIPAGWALCDGNSGTPDLRNRFVIGAGDGTGGTLAIGAQGGSASAVTNTSALHGHTMLMFLAGAHTHGDTISEAGGTHTHLFATGNTTLTQGQMPSHSHTFTGFVNEVGSGGTLGTRTGNNYMLSRYNATATTRDDAPPGFGTAIAPGLAHNHDFPVQLATHTHPCGTISTAADHSHTVAVNQDSGHTHTAPTLPAFHALYLIIKQ
jgi:hypothetical protein